MRCVCVRLYLQHRGKNKKRFLEDVDRHVTYSYSSLHATDQDRLITQEMAVLSAFD